MTRRQESMNKTLVAVDIRREVDIAAFEEVLGNVDNASYYAFTPMGAWLLQRRGIEFQTLNSVLTNDDYHRRGVDNFNAVESVLRAKSPDKDETLLGLMSPLKQLADFLMQEEAKFHLLKNCRSIIITDTSPEPSHVIGAYLENRCSVYMQLLKDCEVIYLTRKSRSRIQQFMMKLSRVGPANLMSKLKQHATKALFMIADMLAPDRPQIIFESRYDWASCYKYFAKRYRILSINQFMQGLPATSGNFMSDEKVNVQVQRIWEDYCSKLAHIDDMLLHHVKGAILSEIAAYLSFASSLARTIAAHPAYAEGIQALLLTYCLNPREYIIASILKTAGKLTVFYQHGSYLHRSIAVRYYEVTPARINLSYGIKDKSFLEHSGKRSFAVGSTTLRNYRRRFQTPQKKAFYLLDVTDGAGSRVDSEFHWPEPDGIELFKRHCSVIELFGESAGWSLTLRPHPSHRSFALYEPLKEYVMEKRYSNITFDESSDTADRFLEKGEWVILDYVCTGLIQGLAKDIRNMMCYIGKPYVLPSDDVSILKQVFPCGSDQDELLALIKKHLFQDEKFLANEISRTMLRSMWLGPQDRSLDLNGINTLVNAEIQRYSSNAGCEPERIAEQH